MTKIFIYGNLYNKYYLTPCIVGYKIRRNKVLESNKRAFLHSSQFDDLWTKLGLNDDDLRKLQNLIIKNPSSGRLIRGTGGFRKIRFGSEGSGKRGGFRVIYMDLSAYSFVYLLMVYKKTEKATISDEERKALRSISKATIDVFRKREVQW